MLSPTNATSRSSTLMRLPPISADQTIFPTESTRAARCNPWYEQKSFTFCMSCPEGAKHTGRSGDFKFDRKVIVSLHAIGYGLTFLIAENSNGQSDLLPFSSL